MSLEDSVSASPAKTDSAYFVRAWDHSDSVDKAINQRLCDSFTMLDQPRTEGGGNQSGISGFLGDGELFLFLKRRFDVL